MVVWSLVLLNPQRVAQSHGRGLSSGTEAEGAGCAPAQAISSPW
jgi:putative effector of murein hydrolase